MPSLFKTAFYILLAAIIIFLVKQYSQGCVCTSKARLDGKITIITGANTGIGKETAVDFAKRGARVYMACRSLERGESARQEILNQTGADPAQVVVMKLDLSSLQSVRQFVQEFKAREGRVHLLINNAGVMWVPESKSADNYELTFATNHLGHFLLTHLLIDLLYAAQPSRIVTVSSYGHTLGSGVINWEDIMMTKDYSRVASYSQSKLANVMFSAELGHRLKGTGITTYSLHPGSILTELGRHIVSNPYLREALKYLLWPLLKDAFHGAQTQIYCAVVEDLARESGQYYSDCRLAEPLEFTQSSENNKRLWDLSLELVKLQSTEIHPLLK